MEKKLYKSCSKTTIDTYDLNVHFDENGVCDHCHDFENKVNPSGTLTSVRGKK
jgi:hypothetical protein